MQTTQLKVYPACAAISCNHSVLPKSAEWQQTQLQHADLACAERHTNSAARIKLSLAGGAASGVTGHWPNPTGIQTEPE